MTEKIFTWTTRDLAHPGKRYQGQFIDGLIAVALFGASLYLCNLLSIIGSAADAIIISLPLSYLFLSDAMPKGQSLGKKLLNISVVSNTTGKPCSLWQSLIRNMLTPILGIIDALLILGKKRQRLGDKLANTIVIKNQSLNHCFSAEDNPPKDSLATAVNPTKTDPYQAPQSELTPGTQAYRPSFGWKILLFVLIPLELWSQYETFTINEYNDSMLWLLFSLAVYCIFYIGLYGLAFRKKFGQRKFWLAFLPLLLIVDFIDIMTIFSDTDLFSTESIILVILVGLFELLIVTAIYKYQKYLHHF